MNKQRLSEIMNDASIKNILYNNEHVWVQEVRNNMATIGFLNGCQEREVDIKDLYEVK